MQFLSRKVEAFKSETTNRQRTDRRDRTHYHSLIRRW